MVAARLDEVQGRQTRTCSVASCGTRFTRLACAETQDDRVSWLERGVIDTGANVSDDSNPFVAENGGIAGSWDTSLLDEDVLSQWRISVNMLCREASDGSLGYTYCVAKPCILDLNENLPGLHFVQDDILKPEWCSYFIHHVRLRGDVLEVGH